MRYYTHGYGTLKCRKCGNTVVCCHGQCSQCERSAIVYDNRSRTTNNASTVVVYSKS